MSNEHDPADCDPDLLWALALGVLAEAEVDAREAHLASCAACRRRLQVIRADCDSLGCHAGGDSPEALAERVLARSRGLEARAKRLRWLAVGFLFVAALAGGVYAAHVLVARALGRQKLRRLEHAIERIQNREGRYPADEAELARALARARDPEVRLDARGRPLDHWGQPFRYRFPGVHVPELFDLWSPGPDGVDEEGAPDDQTNWR